MSHTGRNPFAVSSDAPTLADLTHLHRSRILHKERLRTTRPMIDNAAPPEFPHLRCNPKKIQAEYEEQARIQRANIQMVEKMRSLLRPTDTAARPPPNQTSLLNEISAPPPPPPTLHAVARAKRHDKITQDNLKLYKRLAAVPPVHSRAQWVAHAEEKRRRAQNASRFPYQDPLSRGPGASVAALHDFGVITEQQRAEIEADQAARGTTSNGVAPANATQRKRLEFLQAHGSGGGASARDHHSDGSARIPTAQSRAWHALAGTDPVAPGPTTTLAAQQRREHGAAALHAAANAGRRGGRKRRDADDANAAAYQRGPSGKKNTTTLILNPNASLSLPQMRSLFARETAPQTTLLRGETLLSNRHVAVVVSELVTPQWAIEIRVLDLPSLTAYAVSLPVAQLKSVYGRQNAMFDPGHRVGLARALLASCCFVPNNPAEADENDDNSDDEHGHDHDDGLGQDTDREQGADGSSSTRGSPRRRAPARRQLAPAMSLCIDLKPDMTVSVAPEDNNNNDIRANQHPDYYGDDGSGDGQYGDYDSSGDQGGYYDDQGYGNNGQQTYHSSADSRAYLASRRPPLPAPTPSGASGAPSNANANAHSRRGGAVSSHLPALYPPAHDDDHGDASNDPTVALFTPKARVVVSQSSPQGDGDGGDGGRFSASPVGSTSPTGSASGFHSNGGVAAPMARRRASNPASPLRGIPEPRSVGDSEALSDADAGTGGDGHSSRPLSPTSTAAHGHNAAGEKDAKARARQQQQEAYYAQLASPLAPRSGRRSSQVMGSGDALGPAMTPAPRSGSTDNLHKGGDLRRLRESKGETQRQQQQQQQQQQRAGMRRGSSASVQQQQQQQQPQPQGMSQAQIMQNNLLHAQNLLQIQQQLERQRRSSIPGLSGPLGPGLGEAFPGEWAAAQAAQHTYDADSGLAPAPSGQGTHLLTVQLSCHNLPLRAMDPAAAAAAAEAAAATAKEVTIAARYANPIAFVYRRGADGGWEFSGQTTECLAEVGNPVFAQQLVLEYYPESPSAEFAIMLLDVESVNVDYVNQAFHKQFEMYKERVRGGKISLPDKPPAETGETLGSFAVFATDVVSQRKVITALVDGDGNPVEGEDGSQVLVRLDAISLSYD